ncbi:hypothetical protein BVX97_06125, partial [bacterium E08(2017)]
SAMGANDGTTITTLIEENFDSGAPAWTKGGTWEVGRPLSGPGTGYSPMDCAGTDLDAFYGNNLDDRLVSPVISLPHETNNAERLTLRYQEWISTELGLDEGITEISTNSGVSWTELRRVSGSSNSWNEIKIDLTPYAGNDVYLGFRFISDDSITDSGWYVDDFSIEHTTSPPLSGSITSLNSLNFPFVYLNVAAWTNGIFVDTLTATNFIVYEDSVQQTKRLNILSPSDGGGQRLADIVFIMDNSGSMSDEQAAVESNVVDFVNGLVSEGVDFALGLCRYGQYADNGNPIIEDNGILTTDAKYFKDTVWKRNIDDGGTEPGYFSMVECTKKFIFRPGAQKIFIIITDEEPDQGGATQQEAIDACRNAGVTLFALTETGLFNLFTPITDPTNGECYDIFSDFALILDAIRSYVAQSYLVSYEADDSSASGSSRKVDVVVTNKNSSVTLSWEYIPRAAPKIQRTDTTLNLHDFSHPAGAAITIEARIIDNVAPFAQSATLYYKCTSNSVYMPAVMTNTAGNIWQADIPASAMMYPGVDYFMSATDGETTTSDPSMDPFSARYQLGITPNYAPFMAHTPVSSPPLDTDLSINCNIGDTTASLASSRLYYRKTGQLLYQSTNMTFVSGSQYRGIIPASYVTADGVDYYIRAVDDRDVGTYDGTPDVPHQTLLPMITVSPLSLNASLQTGLMETQAITIASHVSSAGPLSFELSAGDSAVAGAISFSPMAGLISTPGDSVDVEVVFNAAGLDGGLYNTDIIVLSNDPNNNRVVVTGRLDVTAAPDIALSSSALNFGDVFLGTTATQKLCCLNIGFAQLNVSSISCNNVDFAPDSTPFALASGASNVIDVVFTPSALGSSAGTVTVTSNDPNEPSLQLTASANVLPPPVMTVSPASISVTLPAGGSANRTITIGNTAGGSDLEYSLSLYGSVIDVNPSDDYGYTWLDSNDAGGPDFQWFDITSIGTNANLVGDDTSVTAALPFTFRYYGKARNTLRISSNGYITFGDSATRTSGTTPDTSTPNDTIAVLWDDLESGKNGQVYTYHDQHMGRFIIQFNDWVEYGGSDLLTFQVHICDNGNIYYFYKDINGNPSCTVGIENATGTDGLLISSVSTYLTNSLAIKIFPQGSFIGAGAGQGVVPAGQQLAVPVSINADDLPAGTYTRNVVIQGNDPLNPSNTVPVTMIVQGTPDISLDTSSIDFGECFINNSYTSIVRVANTGSSELIVSSSSVDHGYFSVDTSGFSVPAGDMHLLEVVYSPTVVGGTIAGTLRINSSDGDTPVAQVSLAGERNYPPVLNVDTNLIRRSLHVNTTGTCSLVLSNTGLGELVYNYILQVTNTVGYSWQDSNDAGGPSYAWTDISGVGTATGLTGDDASVTLNLPFAFPFYGSDKTSIEISSNGYILLGDGSATSTGGSVPDVSTPNGVIAPFWDDLHQRSGTAYYYHDSANKKYIIQYSNWGNYSGTTSSYTFQVHLCENGQIYFYYNNMSGITDEAEIGIENDDGTEGIQVSGQTAYVQNGLAVRFAPSGSFISPPLSSGTVGPGTSTNITFLLDANDLVSLDYYANIVITCNDPLRSTAVIPVHLDVDGLFTDVTYNQWELAYWPTGGSGGQDADFDLDGMSNYDEWVAGTDPTRADSILRLDGELNNQKLPDGFRLRWPSIGGRLYAIEYSQDLLSGFQPLQSNITATPPLNSYNVTGHSGLDHCHYRIMTSNP